MANTYLTRTPSSTGNQQKVTFSVWIKRCKLGGEAIYSIGGAVDQNYYVDLIFDSGFLEMNWYDGSGNHSIKTNRLFRDTSAWYHLVVAIDTTQSTASNRVKIYVNGILETSFSSADYMNQNQNMLFNTSSREIRIGQRVNGSDSANIIMSHFHCADGTAYTPTVFGETDSTTGEWKIKVSPSFTLGTNGFTILKNGNTITDQSANSNNFSLGGGTLTKTEDSPSNVFATWNPLQATTSASYDFSAGNTRMAVNDAAVFSLGATLAAKTGKYYMEMKWVQQGGNGSWGMIPINTNIKNRPRNAGVGWNQGDNAPWLLGSIVSGSWGGSIGTGDIIQLAMDLDNGAFYFGKNGTYLNSGNPTSGASKTGAVDFSGTTMFGEDITFAIGKGASGTDGWNANFGNGYFEQTAVSSAGTNASGNGIFEYDVPTGFTALSTKGLNT